MLGVDCKQLSTVHHNNVKLRQFYSALKASRADATFLNCDWIEDMRIQLYELFRFRCDELNCVGIVEMTQHRIDVEVLTCSPLVPFPHLILLLLYSSVFQLTSLSNHVSI